MIKLHATADGQSLVVTSFVNSHNHELSREEFKLNPAVRKLDSETEKEIQSIVRMNGNRKLIQQYYAEKTGKAILMRDIHNLAARAVSDVSTTPTPTSYVQGVTEWLQKECPDVDHHFVLDENDVVQAVFLQDSLMKTTFEKFPELILADSTHIKQMRMICPSLPC